MTKEGNCLSAYKEDFKTGYILNPNSFIAKLEHIHVQQS